MESFFFNPILVKEMRERFRSKKNVLDPRALPACHGRDSARFFADGPDTGGSAR